MSGFASARTIRDALSLHDTHRGEHPVFLAGGTDWMVEEHLRPNPWKTTAATPTHGPIQHFVIDISRVKELQRVERFTGDDGQPWIRLGAGVTYRTLRTHPELVASVPMLGAMAADVGAVQIQARGTLGGNLATGSPAADGVPVLAALGAVVQLTSATGSREVPIEVFYTGYKRTERRFGELIEAVAFPVPTQWARTYWRKVGTRRAQSISKVALASVLELDRGTISVARLAMASVGPTVALLPRVRAALVGKALSDIDLGEVIRALHGDIKPIDDVRSTGAYRMHVAERVLTRMLQSL